MVYWTRGYKAYDRDSALSYSNRWALDRNPQYLDFSNLGGDCTNFVSQCIYAGSHVMNYDILMGWYYIDGNRKAPAWTGVPFLYQFLTRMDISPGPYGREVPIWEIEPGDIIQLSFHVGDRFRHSLFVMECGDNPDFNNIFVNTHSEDRLGYPLRGFSWSSIRFIKVLGIWT